MLKKISMNAIEKANAFRPIAFSPTKKESLKSWGVMSGFDVGFSAILYLFFQVFLKNKTKV
jgi:hypothetical protein